MIRRYDEAIDRARQMLKVAPDFHYARVILGACRGGQGRYPEAIAEFEQAVRGVGREPFILGRLGHALALAGRRAEAERVLRELEADLKTAPDVNVNAAFVHVGLRDTPGALNALEQAQAHSETPHPVMLPRRAAGASGFA